MLKGQKFDEVQDQLVLYRGMNEDLHVKLADQERQMEVFKTTINQLTVNISEERIKSCVEKVFQDSENKLMKIAVQQNQFAYSIQKQVQGIKNDMKNTYDRSADYVEKRFDYLGKDIENMVIINRELLSIIKQQK